jgi:hypothetical protein
MFSADAAFSGAWDPEPPIGAQALSYREVLGDSEHVKVGAVEASSALRYVGRTHEVIDAGDVSALAPCGLTVDYSGVWDIARKQARWRLDIELLKDDYSPRGRFYLAQSFACLGHVHEAFAYYMIRIEQRGFDLERRQAIVGAICTAPTIALARFAANHERDVAEVQLALAEREARAGNREHARGALLLALRCTKRSMFQRRDLALVCAKMLEDLSDEP